MELGTQYTADELSGRAGLPEPLPLGQRLQEHFLRQVRSLSPDAQAFALLAAADPGGDLYLAAARGGAGRHRPRCGLSRNGRGRSAGVSRQLGAVPLPAAAVRGVSRRGRR